MYQNSVVVRAIATARVADLRQAAGPRARDRGDRSGHRSIQTARRATGWLLVDLGLRLALPRGGTKHHVARQAGSQ
jgi:hypothetical protein